MAIETSKKQLVETARALGAEKVPSYSHTNAQGYNVGNGDNIAISFGIYGTTARLWYYKGYGDAAEQTGFYYSVVR